MIGLECWYYEWERKDGFKTVEKECWEILSSWHLRRKDRINLRGNR
jgi:hypothetical protein